MEESLWSLFDAWEEILEHAYASDRLRVPGARRSARTGRPLALPTTLLTLESLSGTLAREDVQVSAAAAVLDVPSTD
ncbi:MAG: hypothetical protein AAFX85_16775, partial [Pseudomonadota bacterium]